ncbi:MAG: hypothetical protein U0746_16290 [Gemmataceae bacterium]
MTVYQRLAFPLLLVALTLICGLSVTLAVRADVDEPDEVGVGDDGGGTQPVNGGATCRQANQQCNANGTSCFQLVTFAPVTCPAPGSQRLVSAVGYTGGNNITFKTCIYSASGFCQVTGSNTANCGNGIIYGEACCTLNPLTGAVSCPSIVCVGQGVNAGLLAGQFSTC